jgi:hypothetical protein
MQLMAHRMVPILRESHVVMFGVESNVRGSSIELVSINGDGGIRGLCSHGSGNLQNAYQVYQRF